MKQSISLWEMLKERKSLNNDLKLILDTSLEPMKLWCDNKADIASSKINGGNTLKHMPKFTQ